MLYRRPAAGALIAAAMAGLPATAQAQSASDLAQLRTEMEAMRQEYEARIGQLETRIAEAEAAQQANAAPSADQLVELAPPPAAAVSAPASQNLYNPGIAVALNGLYTAARNATGAETIAGFSGGEEIGHPERGFSLGESEVSFAANIDPFLSAFFDISLDAQNEAAVEEAYIRTTQLPAGLTLKAGRFLSGIGYLNERHAHDWSFSDAPLPYRAFLGPQLGDDGVQLRWLAPTPFFLELGGEALRGESYPAGGAANDGVGAYSLFARAGGDLGVSGSYLAGLSYLQTDADARESGDGDLFSGENRLGIATLVYKWAPRGNPLVRNLTLVGEYFYGVDEGDFNGVALDQAHSGWYAQGVYQFMPRWSVGLRVAGLSSDDPGALLAGSALDDLGHSPFDVTGLVEFDTSEFGRLRLQYSRDDAAALSDPNDIVTLQYTVIYGPHGAHRY